MFIAMVKAQRFIRRISQGVPAVMNQEQDICQRNLREREKHVFARARVSSVAIVPTKARGACIVQELQETSPGRSSEEGSFESMGRV